MALAVGKDANFLSMDARLMWSNAPMPSMLNTQERLFKSVAALNMWRTHSVPARVDRAYWNGAQAFSTSCPTTLARQLATMRLKAVPVAIPRTRPFGLRSAVIRAVVKASAMPARTSARASLRAA